MVSPGPKNQSKNDRRTQRRTEIVDVAAELFARNGYNATGVAAICDAVGLGKGSLYYYIESKQNLLSLIHDRVMAELFETASEIHTLDVTPLEKLRHLGVELVKIITGYPDHVWVFLHEWPALTGDHAKRFRGQRRRYEKVVEEVLIEGITDGSFAIEDTRAATLTWLGMHNYTYMWYRQGGRLNPMQLAHRYYRIFVEGVAPRGHAVSAFASPESAATADNGNPGLPG